MLKRILGINLQVIDFNGQNTGWVNPSKPQVVYILAEEAPLWLLEHMHIIAQTQHLMMTVGDLNVRRYVHGYGAQDSGWAQLIGFQNITPGLVVSQSSFTEASINSEYIESRHYVSILYRFFRNLVKEVCEVGQWVSVPTGGWVPCLSGEWVHASPAVQERLAGPKGRQDQTAH